MNRSRIPAVAHFLWMGPRLPWVHVLALRSAAQRGGFDRVVFHHDSDLRGSAHWADLQSIPQFESRRLEPEVLFAACGPRGRRLLQRFGQLEKPNARANMLRAAVLYAEGGVYLDMDTVTIRSFTPLLESGVFCGEERIAFPATVVRSRRLRTRARAVALSVVRDSCRRMPNGWKTFRKIENWYPRAVNNAVMGAEAGHPFVSEMLDQMCDLPAEQAIRPYALGTHLLQERAARWRSLELTVHGPEVFYPLGPEISQHWFRQRRLETGASVDLDHILYPETRSVHWYASVRTRGLVSRIDPAYVRKHVHRQFFSALAFPFLS